MGINKKVIAVIERNTNIAFRATLQEADPGDLFGLLLHSRESMREWLDANYDHEQGREAALPLNYTNRIMSISSLLAGIIRGQRDVAPADADSFLAAQTEAITILRMGHQWNAVKTAGMSLVAMAKDSGHPVRQYEALFTLVETARNTNDFFFLKQLIPDMEKMIRASAAYPQGDPSLAGLAVMGLLSVPGQDGKEVLYKHIDALRGLVTLTDSNSFAGIQVRRPFQLFQWPR